jgi:Tfp pilus assembly protein PilV
MRRKLTKFSTRSAKGNTRRTPSGFTLTEVVVASALLIIAIIPILKGLTSAHATTAIIEHKTRSLTLAQAKLDEIRSSSIYNYSGTFNQTSVSLDGPYLCTVADTGAGSNLRTIMVEVGYDSDGNGSLAPDEVDVGLVTLVAKRW